MSQNSYSFRPGQIRFSPHSFGVSGSADHAHYHGECFTNPRPFGRPARWCGDPRCVFVHTRGSVRKIETEMYRAGFSAGGVVESVARLFYPWQLQHQAQIRKAKRADRAVFQILIQY